MTTNLDVLYRYELHPTEAAMIALGKARGVYGIRKISLNEQEKTLRVEFDFTRLNRAVVADLMRQTGIDIVEEIPLAPPPAPKEAPAPACCESPPRHGTYSHPPSRGAPHLAEMWEVTDVRVGASRSVASFQLPAFVDPTSLRDVGHPVFFVRFPPFLSL